jgi:hypothetical protein
MMMATSTLSLTTVLAPAVQLGMVDRCHSMELLHVRPYPHERVDLRVTWDLDHYKASNVGRISI